MAVMSDQEAGRIGGGLVVAGCLATAAGVGWEFGAGWGVVVLGAWLVLLGGMAAAVAASRAP
jgi:hypothetical protein